MFVQVLPGLEPGSWDSESQVMTITLQDRGVSAPESLTRWHDYSTRARAGTFAVGWQPWVYSSAVEHRIADPAVAGSIPAAPLIEIFFFRTETM